MTEIDMPSLLDILQRRKRAREFTEGFREKATPEEREHYDRFYQEPTASAVFARGELGSQIDEVESLKRQLMARGMGNLQAGDRARRELEQEEAELGRTAQSIETQYGPGGIYGTGEGSFAGYEQSLRDAKSDPSSAGWGIHPDDRDVSGLSLEDWSKQRAMARRDASGVSAESKARYEEQTVDDRIEMVEKQAAATEALLDSQVADAELNIPYKRHLRELVEAVKRDPTKAQAAATVASKMHEIVKGSGGGGGGINSYSISDDPQKFINAMEEVMQEGQEIINEGQSGTGRQEFIPVPTTEVVPGDYPR
jgi:hypothetical protein